MLKYLLSIFVVPKDKPELARAQLKIFSHQMPYMYAIIAVGMFALSYTHSHLAPLYLTVYIPCLLMALLVWRVSVYGKIGKEAAIEEVRLRLNATTVMAVVMGLVFSAWSISLFPYGTDQSHGHIVFFMGITSFGSIMSVMHFRPAALALTTSTVLPVFFYFSSTKEPVLVAIGVNMLLVGGLMLIVVSRFYSTFVQSIENAQALIEKQAETQKLSDINSRLASMDILTDLPNRRGFFAELGKCLDARTSEPCGLIVGLLDLDGFKPINDIYGHPMGDRLLVQVADRLKQSLPDGVYASRIGGDEFGLIFAPGVLGDDIVYGAERICALMRKPFDMDGFVAQMTGSLGLVKHQCAGDTAEELFERADYALYNAKEYKNGGAVLFSEEHAETIRQVNGIERRLRDADLEEEMSIAFQPIVDIHTHQVSGLEVLARWENAVLGTIPPATFIRAAERAGMINRLTEILFRKALSAAKKWPDDVFISFNLSPYDIGAPECILRLVSMFEKSGLSSGRLVFEVTETAVMQDFNRACETLQCLKNMGASIALDYFGTGYSSLSHVRRLPLDRLKVDRSFVTELEHDARACSIMKSVVDLCRNLGFDCIVEGVETEGQLEILRQMGVRYIQGYLFSRPMNEALVEKYLNVERGPLQMAGAE